MKIISIVGARPEFVQAMPVSRALRVNHQELIVHTGQHYDYQMSQAFFDELEIPLPDYNLGVGSASHTQQIAQIMTQLEPVLIKERPDWVIVRGDTNSSLASAIVTRSLGIPLAHIEAGERSFNRSMPEEINRLVTDRLADMHFCVSEAAVGHLGAEGIKDTVHLVGDVMLDALLFARPIATSKSKILDQLQIAPKEYALVTIHRAANTNDPARLKQIMSALNSISEKIILPIHPRTKKVLTSLSLNLGTHIKIIEPVGYFDMLTLEDQARLIATDSGGVQREAYYLEIPCLTLRDETEWVATLETGWNKLVGADKDSILDAWFNFRPPVEHPSVYGTGNAARQIAEILTSPGDRLSNSAKLLETRK